MNPLEPLASFLPPPIGPAAGGKTFALGNAAADEASSAKASISDLGRALSHMSSKTASSASKRNQDIDDSDLPDSVKTLLRMIRELREKLAELARELQEVQADPHMNPEVKRSRLLQLQAQMSALNGAMLMASRKLTSLMRDLKLDKAQQISAAQLALK
ncbi:hypothetical protein ACFO0J_02330 [Castellaniella hirudinis]|uniref:Uncharacterized protein n=1 Tax=Castellaniella hirudinis TaxID=1144617 RepID=A0ABV8RUL3_9BURK